MKPIPNQRLQSLSGSVFYEIERARREVAAQGKSIINLSIGSPDQAPDIQVREVLSRGVLRDDVYHYSVVLDSDLPAAIAYRYQQRFGVSLDPQRHVLDMMGSQAGWGYIFLGLVDPGDVVLVPDPAYPIYLAAPVLAGAQIHPVPLTAENNYLPDLDAIPPAVLNRAKAIIINYPSNPTTAVADVDFFAEVTQWAQHWGIWVLHDAAYSDLAFDGYRPPSFLEAPGAFEVGIEFNSLSKTYNLAGCRVGFAVGSPELIKVFREVKNHLDYGTFLPLQETAAFALRHPTLGEEAAKIYEKRRDALVESFREAGWEIPVPRATMFCWAPIPPGFDDDRSFVLELLHKTGVVVTPGSGFGPGGAGYVRIALVQDEADLREAARRIAQSGLIKAYQH